MAVKHHTKIKFLIAFVAIILFALLVVFALSGGNMALLKCMVVQDLSNEEMKELLSGFGWRGYIAIAALSMLQVVCAFLPAEPVQVLAGVTFSFPVALLCCIVGIALGNSLIFMLQKVFGNRIRSFFIKNLKLDLETIALSSQATLIIFILYFLPAIPYGMICFLAASLGMSYRRYITVTVLGSLPSVCIGVGLGHMAIMSDWVVSVCVFSALILVAAILIWKKDFFFAKLNNFAGRHSTSHRNAVRPANTFVLTVVYYAARVYLFLCGVRLKTVNKIGKPEAPSIVLCNHGSFIDFIYAAALLRKSKPHFIVARLYFYHNLLGSLLRTVGAFPKSMFALDMENAKNCLTVLKNQEILAMMPEARLSTVGRFEDIQASTYAFIKKAGVSVYTVKISGDYLADPKWGHGFRRGAVVEAELDILYTAEQVKALSPEDLKQGIEERLSYDELQWLRQRPDVHYRCGHLAEGMENILTTCPICGSKFTLTTSKNQISCCNCGKLTSLNSRYGFAEDFQFQDLTQWYDWQLSLLEQEIAADENFALNSQVELRLPGDGKHLTRHGGWGTCTLNREGLTYTGTRDGEEVTLRFPIQRLYRLLFGAGENFEIYDGAQILYFVPEEKRSAVQWYMASKLLHDEAAR